MEGGRLPWRRAPACASVSGRVGKLTPEERLPLFEQPWESLSETPEVVPLTEAQRDELDRRLDELDREGPGGIPWAEAYHRIRSRMR